MLNAGSILGRSDELAVLNAALASARDQGAVVLVVGEPGIGKSALLSSAAATAREGGYTVLSAAGVESEMHLPFAGIHQVLAPVMRHLADLPGPQRQAIAAAFGLSEETNPHLFLTAEAACTLLGRERAERPVAIIVDDAQWLDPQSHQILTFVAHRGVGTGISVLAAIRPEHGGPFVDAQFPQLDVGGLDDRTAEQILSANAGVLSFADLKTIREEAQGNPLALLELPRSWGDGPSGEGHALAVSAKLERAFAGRISELPAGTRDALLVAAVGSSSHIDEVLRAVAAFGAPEPGPELFRPAVAAGLVALDLTEIRFRHPLVRSSVVQRETLTRRHAAHAALAQVLDGDRFRRTWHRAWSIVGPDDAVAEELVAAVPDSLRRGAVMSAVSSLERAAHLTSSSAERGHLLVTAADRAFEAGRADVVARLLREVAEVDLTELDQARVTWLQEALNGDVRADSALVRHLCVTSVRAVALGDEGLALNLLLAAALRCWWADSGAADRAEVVRMLDRMPPDARLDPRHLAAVSIAEPVLKGSEVMRSLDAIDLDAVRDGQALRVYGMAAYGIGDLVLATELLDRAEESFRRQGQLGMLPVVLALQLHIRLDLGDWSGAVQAGREVVTISKETGQPLFAENNILVEARGMALRGEWRAAIGSMATAEAEATRSGVNDRICLAYQAKGAALLSAHRPAEAFECLRRQYDPGDAGYHLRESFAGVALMAEAAVACGRVEDARRITRGMQTLAVITPAPLLAINLLYAGAVLAPVEVREAHFQDALAHDLTWWPWMRARVQLAYGQWSAENGHPDRARTNLDAALGVFQRIGAVRWADVARSSLARLAEAESDPP